MAWFFRSAKVTNKGQDPSTMFNIRFGVVFNKNHDVTGEKRDLSAVRRTRTGDRSVNSRVLYQLS